MPDALLATRCAQCGWPLESHPNYAASPDRWVQCDNQKCAEHGNRYAIPRMPLQPYRGKDAAEV